MLISNISSAWIAYKDRAIDNYALVDRLKYSDKTLKLEFPYNPAICEELNCIVKGVDYEIERDRQLNICFSSRANQSPFVINNYTQLPYKIDRSPNARPLLVYVAEEERDIQIVEAGADLGRDRVRFLSDTEMECSSNLIGKTICLSCSILVERWINDSKNRIVEPIDCYLASTKEVQTLRGEIAPLPNVDLHEPTRVVVLKNVREVARDIL